MSRINFGKKSKSKGSFLFSGTSLLILIYLLLLLGIIFAFFQMFNANEINRRRLHLHNLL